MSAIARRVSLGLAVCMSMASGVAWAAPPTEEVLRVAVHMGAVRDATRADIEASLGVWANELTGLLEVQSEVHFYENLSGVRQALQSGTVNFIIADALSLVRHFDLETLADGFGGGGRSEDNMLLISRKGAGIQSASDLAGKRVVLLDDNDISDLLLETACLKKLRQSCAKARVKIDKANRSRQQVLKLFFDNADAAIVRGYAYDLAVELNPQILSKIQIVERYPVYGGALGMFSNRVSPKFREYVILKAPQIVNYPRGRQLMSVLQADSIRRMPRSILDPVKALIVEHDALTLQLGARAASK